MASGFSPISESDTAGRLLAEASPGDNAPALSVSELAFALKRVVEDSFGMVRLRGEISGYKRAASGHAYLTLKDDKACIDAVMWKAGVAGLAFRPEDGIEVIATGKLTTYPGRSKYQIVIERLELAGEGALMLLLEKLKQKLSAEGLFDSGAKKKLPFLPQRIGVVTSPTGAVIRDILHRLEDRCPTHVLVWPVQVQGQGAAEQVAAAIAGFCRLPEGQRPDLVIVARGGGSIEDLWAFNEEVVVRAVAACAIPIISAVGHETDTTLCDYAADVRAPTPTAAAEMAVPVRSELLATVDDLAARHLAAVARRIERDRRELRAAARALPGPENLLAIPRRTFDELSSRLGRGLMANARAHRVQFERAAARLSIASIGHMISRCGERAQALGDRAYQGVKRQLERKRAELEPAARALPLVSYHEILARGFAVVRSGGVPVRSTAAVPPGAKLDIQFHDGNVGAIADGTAAPKKKAPSGSQGSLF
jgi:exodeoxyribonuclease VII large subunit